MVWRPFMRQTREIVETRSILGTGTEKVRLENAGLETRERIGYGKPIKPKQPTHFQMLI